jgi:formylglycine-generating enzyme required for sulfatase activity
MLAGLCAVGCTAEPVVWKEPHTGIELVRLPAGHFTMGGAPGEPGREGQEVRHEVTLRSPFYLGRYEITQGQWQQVMAANPSSFTDCGADCPVEQVSWLDVQEFIQRLERLSGERFRLPTEAEWEYACRAGTTGPFSTGDHLSTDDANYDGHYPYAEDPPGIYRARTTPVGSFAPNAWGLYDLHGNVWEWIEDRHCPYPEGPVVDPVGDCSSKLRVIRGGSWYFNAESARCALRYTHRPQDIGPSLGFRLARDLE